MNIKTRKAIAWAVAALALVMVLCIGCTHKVNSGNESAASFVITGASSPQELTETPTSTASTAIMSIITESTTEKSTVAKPTSQYPEWGAWKMPVKRHDLISYDELLAKMPAITPNANASRFTAEDGTAGGVKDGDTINSIKKKLGNPVAIYDDRNGEGLMRYYMYEGVYFSMFKEISEDGGETYHEYRESDIVMAAVIYGEGIEGPRGIKIGDTFESVMAMYPQDKDYLKNEMFYGKYAFSGPSGKVYVWDITGYNDPFEKSEGPGCPVQVILVPDDYRPFVKLFFDDNLILREMRICYENYPFG